MLRPTSLLLPALCAFLLIGLPACGDDDGGGGGDGDATGSDAGDGSTGGDGGGGGDLAGCVEGGPQCNNCVDDDGDDLIDGQDPECTGPQDEREDSFATGIPGDNVDPVSQDCFFDGNSGEGDDGCFRPTCCLTEGLSETCPPPGPPPNDCSVTQQCIDYCAPLTPPGCDCFGCCTVCNDDGCVDIASGLAGDGCTAENLDDEEACPRCVKATDCTGGDCQGEDCILCPGETEDDLPDTCEGNECPNGGSPCGDNGDCAEGDYCSNGCCIATVE